MILVQVAILSPFGLALFFFSAEWSLSALPRNFDGELCRNGIAALILRRQTLERTESGAAPDANEFYLLRRKAAMPKLAKPSNSVVAPASGVVTGG